GKGGEGEREEQEKLSRNLSKVRSTLRQFVRDWAEEGAEEREAAYGPLLRALEEHLPITPGQDPPRVLCPGSGLGRLPFEVMRKGYACQGNEFSYFMLIGSDFLLNSRLTPKSLPLQPYCLSTSNRRSQTDHLDVVWVPDVAPSEHVGPSADFSMCAGEFVEVYGNPSTSLPSSSRVFDGVLTSFFLDTARNVLLYIKTIARIVRPRGLWANVGPLLYHYAEMPHEMCVEFSAEEILAGKP
ncbi:GD16577, related, partial [Eimeria necatrix]